MDSLLTVDSLQVQFNTKKGINTAVDGISFSVGKGEILGIVGESGCIGGAACLTHGPKNKLDVDKYGQLAKEKTMTDAISVYDFE